MPNTDSNSSINSIGLRVGRSHLFIKVKIGTPRLRQTSNSFRVCVSIPFAASMTMMTASTAVNTRYVSSEKSLWPGVSNKLIRNPE